MNKSSWPERKPLPRWKQAEEYFKRFRDGKVEVTLPRVTILEREEEEAA